MTMTDPVADMLTRIRNGIQVRRKTVDVPSSRLKAALALVLKEEGYIRDVEALQGTDGFPAIRIHLKYDVDGTSAITKIDRTSKPGRRVYTSRDAIPVIRRGMGTPILTTPKGVVTGRKATELGVGGEILCTVF